ncbi:MAG: alcohol dehydrogenase catalytic domain-containing protein [Candidatus Sumerlaeia bacterium]
MTTNLPEKIHAVQLTGVDKLELNKEKPLVKPGPHQLLCKVQAVGLCFSDLKLLKQFDKHPRKTPCLSGIDKDALKEIPSYVPNDQPTVPGHEVVVEVVEAGPDTKTEVGTRALVQTDYRWIKTSANNAAFGYNFEGALQEYVIMDERVIISPQGESMLIPVPRKGLNAAAICLVEPWACVEDAYVSKERQTALAGGKMLVVVDAGYKPKGVEDTFSPDGPPKSVTCYAVEDAVVKDLCSKNEVECIDDMDDLPDDAAYDDIIYFGNDKDTVEKLDRMLAPGGLLNIVQAGKKFNQEINISVGRIHYGHIRFVGTITDSAADSLKAIPEIPELREGEKVLVVGAAGPMGVMHVIRCLCQGVKDVEVYATDFDDIRLSALYDKAAPLAQKNGLHYQSFNPSEHKNIPQGSYTQIMVPIPDLVAQAVRDSLPKGIINIFAGIPATVFHDIDMDAYIEKKLYFVGTSGSSIDDMRIVLKKVAGDKLDTNVSVAAVSGMAGAIDGIRAVENRSISGKIIVYPELQNLPLVKVEELEEKYPSVYEKMDKGLWTQAAEDELLRKAS